MNKKLYVGNLLYEVTDDDLRDQFSQIGAVASASVVRYADSGRSKGFGFVEMETEEDAQKAIDQFNSQDLKGRKLIVSEARPPQPRSFDRQGGGGGGYRGGGGGGDRGGDRFNRRDNNRGDRFNNDRNDDMR